MKKKDVWMKVGFFFFFLGYAAVILFHRGAYFEPTNPIKTVKIKNQEIKDGTVEQTYSFQAKNRKTRYIKVQLKKKTKAGELTIQLKDASGTMIAEEIFSDWEAKKLTWSLETKLTVGETYQIVLQYPEKENLSIKKVKLKYNTFHTAAFYGGGLLSVLSVLLVCWDGKKKKAYQTEKAGKIRFYTLPLLVANGIFSFYILEFVFENEAVLQIKPYYLVHNWIFCALIYIILLILLNSLRGALIVGNLFFLFWALANQFVFLFKGQPIQPIDLMNIQTASSVAGEYTYTFSWQMLTATLLTAVILFLTVRSREQKIILPEGKKRWILLGFPILGMLLFVGEFLFLSNTDYISNMKMKVHLWRNQDTYNTYGIPMGFLATGKNMQVDRPEEYSVSEVKEVMEPYEEKSRENQQTETELPNIIAIMDESFTDLSYIKPDLETNVPYLSFYNSLKENTIKGHLLVSPFGGWTANSEYEFLFGHSMEFLGAAIPYSQYLNSTHSTLAANLNLLGYDTIAFHPHKANNWRRASVYPKIGFEQFLSRDDIEISDEDKVRDYISDEADFEELYKIMDEKEAGEKEFIFNVTLQNHGGYTYDKDDFTADVQIEGYECPEANQYLSLVKKTDEALEELIEHFQNYEEPVLIVFFGDHAPNLPTDFYSWLYGKSEEELSLEEIQKKYTVPFFIWANYDILEEENVLSSTNYLSTMLVETAGISKTPYQEFLTELQKEIPAINCNGYVDKNGITHRIEEENEYTQWLKQYNMIQYNELFDKKNTVKSFFQMP